MTKKILIYTISIFLMHSLYPQNVEEHRFAGFGSDRIVDGITQPYAHLGDSSTVFILYSIAYNQVKPFNILMELNVGDDVVLKQSYDLRDVLKINEYLINQYVKDSIWYMLGYTILPDNNRKYFVKSFEVNNGIPRFTNFTKYSDIDSLPAVPRIFRSRVLPKDRVAFCGLKETSDRLNSERLFIMLDERKDTLILVPNNEFTSPRVTISGSTFSDAIVIQDTLYGHYFVNQDSLIGFDDNFNIAPLKAFKKSPKLEQDNRYQFGLGTYLQRWGDNVVLSGRGTKAFETEEDVYFQMYDSSLSELIFDERYFLEGIEVVPLANSFVPIDNNLGVMVSFSPLPPPFNIGVPSTLNIRLLNKTTLKDTLFTLKDRNFSSIEDAVRIGKKILLVGFGIETREDKDYDYVFYSADYSELITSVYKNQSFIKTLKFYPNPAQSNGKVNLSWSGIESQNWQLQLYNSQGQLVYNTKITQAQKEVQIQLPQLPKGNYILRATGSNKQVHTGTVVVE